MPSLFLISEKRTGIKRKVRFLMKFKIKIHNRLIALLLVILLCFSLIPYNVFAEQTDYTLTIRHDVSATDYSSATGEDGFINIANIYEGTTTYMKSPIDNSKNYNSGIKNYWAQVKSNDHILKEIVITHGSKTKTVPIPLESGSAQTVNCASDLSLSGTLNILIQPLNVYVQVKAVSPTADITVDYVWGKAAASNEAKYTATVSSNTNGSGEALFLGNDGDNAKWQLTATPDVNYALDYWEFKSAGTNNEWTKDTDSIGQTKYSATIGEDKDYRAVFAPTRIVPETPILVLTKSLDSAQSYQETGILNETLTYNNKSQDTIFPGQLVQPYIQYTKTGSLTGGQNVLIYLYAGNTTEGALLAKFEGTMNSSGTASGKSGALLKPFNLPDGVNQVTVSIKLGDSEAEAATYDIPVGTSGSLDVTTVNSPALSGYSEETRNFDVLAFTDETTGKLSVYAAGSGGILEYGSGGFTYMAGLNLSAGQTGTGQNDNAASINGTKDKLTALVTKGAGGYQLYEYTPAAGKWSAVSGTENEASASDGLVIAPNDVWTRDGGRNVTHWNGTNWTAYSDHKFYDYIRADADTYYALGWDAEDVGKVSKLYRYSDGSWNEFGSLTGLNTLEAAAIDGSILVKENKTLYKVAVDGTKTTIDASGIENKYGTTSYGFDYAGNLYAFTPVGVYGYNDGQWILQSVDGNAKASKGSIENAFSPLANVTLFTGSGGAYYLKTGDTTLTLDPANGEAKFTIKGAIGRPVTEPAAPQLEGYTFTGWYYTTNPTDKNAFDFGTMPAKDVTLTAHWVQDSTGGDPYEDARTNALVLLDTAYNGYAKVDYNSDEWAKMKEAYNNGKTAIADAKDYNAIQSALNTAKAAMSAVSRSNADIATVAITLEKFTLGQGYIIEPILVTVPRNTKASVAITDLITQKIGPYTGAKSKTSSYQHTGTPELGFYLAAVKDLNPLPNNDPPIPQELKERIAADSGTFQFTPVNDDGYLEEFDYWHDSGWFFCVNNYYPGVGSSEVTLKPGDVMRWQFTLWGLGQDLGGGTASGGSDNGIIRADKDNLTWRVAEINTNENKADYGVAYTNAITVLSNLESTQQSVDDALTALNAIKEGEERPGTGSNTDPGTDPGPIDPGTPAPVVEYSKALSDVLTYIRSQVQSAIVGSIGGEWAILSEARGGLTDDGWYSAYLDTLESFLRDPDNVYSYDPATGNVKIHNIKITENERVILALTSIGIDASDFRGFNLLPALLEKDGNGQFKVAAQGLNGAIFALIALDSGKYLQGADGQELRNWCIDYLLEHQKTSGGWDLSGTPDGLANADIAGMALQALAPYYKNSSSYKYAEVKAVVEKAVQALRDIQEEDGSFTYGSEGKTSESAAQVLTALTALGYDGTNDGSFLASVVKNLLTYRDTASGGFRHVMSDSVNQMASEQAAYALVAYDRYVKNKNTLYDMTDVNLKGDDNTNTDGPSDVTVKDLENGTGIFINAKSGVLPSGLELWIDTLDSGDLYEKAKAGLADISGDFKLFDIFLLKNNEETQPKGTITISIPVPDGYDGAGCKVYRINEDGSVTDMNAVLKDGYLVFETNHLSLYAVVQTALTGGTGANVIASGVTNAGASPQTGDVSDTALWLWMGGIALLGIAVTAGRRKKSKRVVLLWRHVKMPPILS